MLPDSNFNTYQLKSYHFFLWFTILSQGLWVGGTVFHMLVVQPMWTFNLPDSLYFFFKKTRFNQTIWNFYGPPWMMLRVLPLLVCLGLSKHLSKFNRKLLLAALICWISITLFTLLYIYPINRVIFEQAGGTNSPSTIATLVKRWLFADRLRFVIGSLGYLLLLYVFSNPVNAPGRQ